MVEINIGSIYQTSGIYKNYIKIIDFYHGKFRYIRLSDGGLSTFHCASYMRERLRSVPDEIAKLLEVVYL